MSPSIWALRLALFLSDAFKTVPVRWRSAREHFKSEIYALPPYQRIFVVINVRDTLTQLKRRKCNLIFHSTPPYPPTPVLAFTIPAARNFTLLTTSPADLKLSRLTCLWNGVGSCTDFCKSRRWYCCQMQTDNVIACLIRGTCRMRYHHELLPLLTTACIRESCKFISIKVPVQI